jgi:DNA-binding transcriptional ArsR family regulator
LSIYINPVRQELLRILSISNKPLTPKMLADKLHISASGVQHHISKLLSLELVELDHTEMINGITARFYKASLVTVQVGLSREDETTSQRQILMQESIARTYDRFYSHMKRIINQKRIVDEASLARWGDVLTGVLHLRKEDSGELMNIINDYIEKHSEPAPDKAAWEYALILYNTEEWKESDE